jgi:hypothetical protein
MLSLLSFKKSMFTGILDGGQDEVFLGGSRLKRFMESVEQASGTIPPSMPHEADLPPEIETETETETTAPAGTEQAVSPKEQAWTEVVSTGLSLLDKLGQALLGDSYPRDPAEKTKQLALPDRLFEKDKESGEPYLKIPMPKPETLQKVITFLGE